MTERMVTDEMIEEVARAWASIDGKRDWFDRCKTDADLEETHGHYGGYIEEAKELLRRSPNVSAALSSLSASAGKAEPVAYVSRKSLDELLSEGSHTAVSTLIHNKPLRSGNGVALYTHPSPSASEAKVPADVIPALTEAALVATFKACVDGDGEPLQMSFKGWPREQEYKILARSVLSALSPDQIETAPQGTFRCDICSRHIQHDAIVSNEEWSRISPTHNEGGTLCAACMVDRLGYAAARITDAHASSTAPQGTETPAPVTHLLAESILTVDMDVPLNAVDRLRALAGGSKDISFEPSDADEILEKLEALAALLSAPQPAPQEQTRPVTDEMVEKAAAAYWLEVYGRHRKSQRWPQDVHGGSEQLFRDGCRAALTAALAMEGK